MMKNRIAVIGCMLLAVGCDSAPEDSAPAAVDADSQAAPVEAPIDRHVPDTLVNTTVLDTLRSATGEAWLVIAGVECTNCDAPETIWLTRDLASGPEHGPYDYPGEDFEMGVEGGEPHGRTRLFVGDCMPEAGDEMVLVLDERDPQGGWQSTMHLVRLDAAPVDSTMPHDAALVTRVSSAAGCTEVAGKTQYGG